MDTIYGHFDDLQIEEYKEKLHKEMFWLLLYKDPKTKDEFKNQFSDKNAEAFEVTKAGASDENEINAISGATITSKAVTGGVNAGICAFNYVKEGE